MFGIFRKSWKFFFGNAEKMHTKVSLLWLRKSEQFSVVLFAFLETRREFYWRRNLTRDCFWDCYWGRAGQLSAIFLSVPSSNPRSLCESYWPIFPLLFLITIPEQSGISLNLRTGPTGHPPLFNQWDGALVFINKQIKTSPQSSKSFKTTDGVGQN